MASNQIHPMMQNDVSIYWKHNGKELLKLNGTVGLPLKLSETQTANDNTISLNFPIIHNTVVQHGYGMYSCHMNDCAHCNVTAYHSYYPRILPAINANETTHTFSPGQDYTLDCAFEVRNIKGAILSTVQPNYTAAMCSISK